MKVPRYRQIKDQIEAQIHAGVYRPGDKLPTEMELAALHGVSRVTSAAALTALAREGLVQRTPRRGTIVTLSPTRGSSPERPLIAWIHSHIDGVFGLGVFNGMEAAAVRAGYGLVLEPSGDSQEDEDRAIHHALAAGAAGLAVFLRDGEKYNAEVLRLVLDGFPLVLVDRHLRGVDCATVHSDNVAAARDLVNELIAAGHRHICPLIYPPRHTSTIEDRLEGYTRALAGARIPVDWSLQYIEKRNTNIPRQWEIADEIIADFASFLRYKTEISAVFATNARLALLALRAAEQLGRRIPEDLSVVSIDAMEAFPLPLPVFTCALQQYEEMGATAVDLLHEQIQGKPPRRVVLPMQLRRGDSIAPPRRIPATIVVP